MPSGEKPMNIRVHSLSGAHFTRTRAGILFCITALAAVFLLVPSSRAGTLTWDSSGTATASTPLDGSGTWNTSTALWNNGSTDAAWVNANNDTAVFGSGNGAAGTVTLGANIQVGGITFNTPGSGNYTIVPGAGTTVTLSGATPTITTNANATISASFAGTTGFVKTGSSKLTLSGTNSQSLSGGMTISGGTLAISANANAATGTITLDGGALEFTGTVFTTVNRAFVLTANGGTLVDSGGTGSSGTTVRYSGGLTMSGSGARTLTFSGTGISGAEFDGVIGDGTGGATSVVKTGTGSWAIVGPNATYSGNTTINAGTLRVNGTNAISPTSTVFLASGATLSVGNTTATNQTIANLQDGTGGGGTITSGFVNPVGLIVQSGSFSGTIKDQSNRILNFTKSTSGTLTLSGTNSYTGATTVSGGTLVAGSNSVLGFGGAYALNTTIGTSTVSGNSTVDLNGRTLNEPLTLSGGNLVNNSVSTATFSNGLAGITYTNAGGTYSGAITVTFSGGGGSGATATAVASTVTTGGTITSITTTAAGSGYTSAPTVTINGSTGGSGTASASAVLSSLALSGTSNNIGGSGNMTIAAAVSDSGGAGGFTKTGAGTVTLSAVNSYSGGTTISGGKLIGTNTTAFGTGTIVVNTSGILHINQGFVPSNTVTMAGGSYERDFNNGDAYHFNAISNLSGTNTTGTVLAGTRAAAGATTLVTSFALNPAASVSNDASRVSDVLSFTGTSNDVFVLQLAVTSLPANSILGWNNSGTWANAVTGDTGNNAIAAQQGYVGSFSSFQGTYGTTLSSYIGAYGIDASGNDVWAVINHNSEFTVITVPEPSTYVMLLGGIGVMILLRRQSKRFNKKG